ncbi:MAG: hypothetical protein R3A47_10825 [Polyangiales bacterium]
MLSSSTGVFGSQGVAFFVVIAMAASAVNAQSNDALLSILDAQGDLTVRNDLNARVALQIELARRNPDELNTVLTHWLNTNPPNEAIASVLESTDGAVPSIDAALLSGALSVQPSFETSYRLLRGPSSLSKQPSFVEFVKTAQRADPWMLRAKALSWATNVAAVDVEKALSDPYPRVRMAAIDQLATQPLTDSRIVDIATIARRDPWPMVRAQAVTSLRRTERGTPIVFAGVDDPSRIVRTAAIGA